MRLLPSALVFLSVSYGSLGAAIDFAHQIVPVLREHCADCHLGDKKKGGFSMNTREDLLAGSENGAVLSLGKVEGHLLIEVLTTKDKDVQMPPKGARVPEEKIALLRKWIEEGVLWEDGFTFGKSAYEPPLKPRLPKLPPVVDGRTNPIDRILDKYLVDHKVPRPKPLNDAGFIRRLTLDFVGVLPTSAEVDAFVNDKKADKRARLIKSTLERRVDYAEHWLTFWNDLLRNDYVGTGYIDGGRKPITNWLYQALVTNKPYDQFARELLSPTPESEGFIFGIKWRGGVNASQVREVQFSQSISQVFLGINMKCASCHDSFIDRWKLDEAYGLAAIYAEQPLEINRCDKPTGRTAQAAWIFPELGTVDAKAPQPERLKQLARLMTHPENGRFTRTMVNRLWHRLMGRGIVHPVDAMGTEPWSEDLLDYLASYLVEQKHDLKAVLALIAGSQAYQSECVTSAEGNEVSHYVYRGPIAKRLTAEQFVDAVWQITGTAPAAAHKSVVRGRPELGVKPAGRWIWANASGHAEAGETLTFRKMVEVKGAPTSASAVISVDNGYEIFLNGASLGKDEDLGTAEVVSLGGLKPGKNYVLVVAKNAGNGPNKAGVYFEANVVLPGGKSQAITSDGTWEWSRSLPDAKGKFARAPEDWQRAHVVKAQQTWDGFMPSITQALGRAHAKAPERVRASVVQSDLLQRALGRPNREQIVTVRPENLTTLEAIDLANGNILAGLLKRGAVDLQQRYPATPELVQGVFRKALSRAPTPDEAALLIEMVGGKHESQGVEDMLWMLMLLPEFQFVR
ncbi:cytochrome c [Roseimicrobium gellanilyticum]|uniref:Cytochrome c n=1 Tax=Roseimicrobium gellanilyticum TaxID=748857 RepID=A0A366HSZ2_9BACT|nr:DUF1549 domain-containing protein [Roseimicrobium gellanilyticum]RBP46043.1 cytochrome c [Roseimicrobium gellanilyticum]